MSIPQTPAPAKYILSILSSTWDEFWPELQAELESRLGPADYCSELIAFTQTTYYDKELGTPLFRRLLSFSDLRNMEELPTIKIFTNAIENRQSQMGKRTINLDPGYLTLERLVLATGKNFTHRVYLGQQIWADLTLIFHGGKWQNLPWTFPDYATAEIQQHLSAVRQTYHAQLKDWKENNTNNSLLC